MCVLKQNLFENAHAAVGPHGYAAIGPHGYAAVGPHGHAAAYVYPAISGYAAAYAYAVYGTSKHMNSIKFNCRLK